MNHLLLIILMSAITTIGQSIRQPLLLNQFQQTIEYNYKGIYGPTCQMS